MNFSFFETMRKTIFISLVLTCLLYSCIKAPTYPIVPHIAFESVSTSFLKSGYTDTITFSFTDGDGDIGPTITSSDTPCACCRPENGDTSFFIKSGFNIFLLDSRDSCISSFASADVEPGGKYKGISGDILVITAIDSKKCFAPPQPGCPVDTVVYSIILRDKAGHLSNVARTSSIIVDGQ